MDKKDLILREAERLFSEKGYYGLGLAELLTACDIPKGSFYYYFPKGKMQRLQETVGIPGSADSPNLQPDLSGLAAALRRSSCALWL